jgi:hypothetical protein
MLKFFCMECNKGLDECQCPDLEERFKERFAGSCIEKTAMAAVEAVRGVKEKEIPKARRGRGRKNAA